MPTLVHRIYKTIKSGVCTVNNAQCYPRHGQVSSLGVKEENLNIINYSNVRLGAHCRSLIVGVGWGDEIKTNLMSSLLVDGFWLIKWIISGPPPPSPDPYGPYVTQWSLCDISDSLYNCRLGSVCLRLRLFFYFERLTKCDRMWWPNIRFAGFLAGCLRADRFSLFSGTNMS